MPAEAPLLNAITSFRLTTRDLPGLLQFYQGVLGFSLHGNEQQISAREMEILGLPGSGRRQSLRMGRQVLSIDAFEYPGRPYPLDSSAASPWFQHLAIVVTDMTLAYPRVSIAAAISDGPQSLPASSGGVKAFKFRDPDGHPLELLQFPAATIPAIWQGRAAVGGEIGVGIDHSAICVASNSASSAFYTCAGLRPQAGTHNHGLAQQRLDGLANANVAVLPLKPPTGIAHLELLAYQDRYRATMSALQPNDIAATRVIWSGTAAALLRDPDGHLSQIERVS